MPGYRALTWSQGHWRVRSISSRGETVRFGFNKIPLAAMWWVNQSGETGWEPRGIWSRKTPRARLWGRRERAIRRLSGMWD